MCKLVGRQFLRCCNPVTGLFGRSASADTDLLAFDKQEVASSPLLDGRVKRFLTSALLGVVTVDEVLAELNSPTVYKQSCDLLTIARLFGRGFLTKDGLVVLVGFTECIC